MKQRQLISAVLIAGILGFSASSAQASTLEQKLYQYQNQYNQLKTQYGQQKQQESAAASRAAGLKQSITALNALITSEKAEIAATEAELEGLEAKRQELEQEKIDKQKQLGAFVRDNYENGSTSYLEVLLNAHSWSDLLNRVEEITYIFNGFIRLQDDLKKLTEEVKQQEAQAKQKQANLQLMIQNKEGTQTSLLQSQQKEQDLFASLSAQEKATLAATSQAQRNIEYVQELIRQEQIDAENAKRQPITGGGGGITAPVSISVNVAALISYAESFTGTPYVWGGTTPSPGFDCSGFVKYVFAHFGVKLSRVSQDQFKEGIPVSKSNLKPGDLVFFQTYAPGASHVGIYVGGGSMVNSESRGVMVTNIFNNRYWAPRYIGARRVLNN